MSRRDTIIIAVLINAGLLIVLFATALKSNSSDQEMSAAPAQNALPAVSELTVKKEAPLAQGDEVDQVLSQYSNAAPLTPPPSPASTATAASAAESKPSFADDLKAITLPDSNSTSSLSVPVVATAPAAPAAPVESVESSSTQYGEVKVKKGDVLEKIARSHHTTVDEIMKLNNLSSTRLKIGQSLRLPPPGQNKRSSAQSDSFPMAKVNDSTPKYYTVKNGDNPWTIAVKNHIKVEELLKLNNLNEERARRLKPGDQLRIK